MQLQRILHLKSDIVVSVTKFLSIFLLVFCEDAYLCPHIFIGNIF